MLEEAGLPSSGVTEECLAESRCSPLLSSAGIRTAMHTLEIVLTTAELFDALDLDRDQLVSPREYRARQPLASMRGAPASPRALALTVTIKGSR